MVSVECCLYDKYQDVDLDNERDVGMSEDGNHCIHCGVCHCVSVGLDEEMGDVRYNDSLIYCGRW